MVQWSGSTSNVRQVTLATFNASGQMLNSTVISRLPVQAQLNISAAASNYGAQIVYSNGTTRTVYGAIK